MVASAGMYKKFVDYLQEHALITPQDVCLLAVSGGVDSVVLSHLFYKKKIPFGIAHAHFNLRIPDADKEAAFVMKLAGKYGVQCHVKKFNTRSYASQKGISLQMAARELRYSWFEALLDSGYSKMVTAHHHGDQMETCVYHLIKGTNLQGLQGMLPRRGKLVRPLLFATKEEIHSYAQKAQLLWCEDQSNREHKYHRNFIRHKIMPLLYQINPQAERTFFTTLTKLQQSQAFLEDYAADLQQKVWRYVAPHYHIDYKQLAGKPWQAMVLTHWLTPFGFAFSQIHQWCTQKHQPGKQIFSPSHRLMADRDTWIVGKHTTLPDDRYLLKHDAQKITLDNEDKISWQLCHDHLSFPLDTDMVLVDYAKLTFPLEIRLWQAGDTFCPLGMGGKHKKVSDLLIDKKVAMHEKAASYVLCSRGDIVWVIGHRLDERFKITAKTTRIALLKRIRKPV